MWLRFTEQSGLGPRGKITAFESGVRRVQVYQSTPITHTWPLSEWVGSGSENIIKPVGK